MLLNKLYLLWLLLKKIWLMLDSKWLDNPFLLMDGSLVMLTSLCLTLVIVASSLKQIPLTQPDLWLWELQLMDRTLELKLN